MFDESSQVFNVQSNHDTTPSDYELQLKEFLRKKDETADERKDIVKSFQADNGKWYEWEESSQEWIESEAPENDNENGEHFKGEEDIEENNSDNEEEKEKLDEDKKRKINPIESKNEKNEIAQPAKRKRSKKKPKKGPNNWLYITGLPADITYEEFFEHFSKTGIISISPYDQQPKIKIYRDELGHCKGDGAVCYHSEESVKLALYILDGGYIRPNKQIKVVKADFSHDNVPNQKNDKPTDGQSKQTTSHKPKLSNAQIKVAKSVMQQALAWNEDDDMGIAKSSALKIIVLEGMFVLSDFDDEHFIEELEEDIASECEKCGEIDKITIFSKNPKGIIIVKFKTSYAAQQCTKLMNGRFFSGRQIKCFYWDGLVDYSITVSSIMGTDAEEKMESKRLDDFGDWLEQEQEELPEEFQLRVEK